MFQRSAAPPRSRHPFGTKRQTMVTAYRPGPPFGRQGLSRRGRVDRTAHKIRWLRTRRRSRSWTDEALQD